MSKEDNDHRSAEKYLDKHNAPIDKTYGLFQRKLDGSEVNPNDKYFVLRYDNGCKDKVFLRKMREALSRLAIDLMEDYPDFK